MNKPPKPAMGLVEIVHETPIIVYNTDNRILVISVLILYISV
jgi:hypothetical protein